MAYQQLTTSIGEVAPKHLFGLIKDCRNLAGKEAILRLFSDGKRDCCDRGPGGDYAPFDVSASRLHVVFMLIPMLYNVKRTEHAELLADVAKIADAGGLKPVLDEVRFSIEQVAGAYARLASHQAMGKVEVEN